MLDAAHRGYEYQDLIVALRLVDVLLGEVADIRVDQKAFESDRFDDLATTDQLGVQQRTQVKHFSGHGEPLGIGVFTADKRGLRLDRLVASVATDISRRSPRTCTYRILLNLSVPTDERLTRVLVSAPDSEPAFAPGVATNRFRFSTEALWANPGQNPLADLLIKHGVKWADVDQFCRLVTLELNAPAASFDLLIPKNAERLLLDRVVRDVGAESYPNADRSASDVASALIGAARAARQQVLEVSRAELLRRAKLRHDFGAVSRAHPVDPTVAVARAGVVDALEVAVRRVATRGGSLVVSAPPGQGKSWICEQLVRRLEAADCLVAEHYCYLGDDDRFVAERVRASTIVGSLLNRVADLAPEAAAALKPRLAASERALAEVLRRAREQAPERMIALIVDGLDHVTRVEGATIGRTDPSLVVAQELAAITLPPGVVLLAFSQPGAHVAIISDATPFDLPAFDRDELTALSGRLGVFAAASATIDQRGRERDQFIDILAARSRGNALHATYLCREVLRNPLIALSPTRALELLPDFEGSLARYYDYILSPLDDGAVWVAELLALIRFAVSRQDLREIRPELGTRLVQVLDRLAPVLVDRSAQGGIRIYHESFARHLRERTEDDRSAILAPVINWLQARGLFADIRAFGFLIELLHAAGRDGEAVDLVGADFTSRAVAAGFSPSAMISNLATVVGSAAARRDWPAVVRCVELARAARTYEFSGIETMLVQHSALSLDILGATRVTEMLLVDGRTTLSPRVGVQVCAGVDEAGGVPPWREYLAALDADDDNTIYDDQSQLDLALAQLRGVLRLAPTKGDDAQKERARRLGAWCNENSSLDPGGVVHVIMDVLGSAAAIAVLPFLANQGPFALAMAEETRGRGGAPSLVAQFVEVALRKPVAGSVHRLLRLGVAPARIAASLRPKDLELVSLTVAMERRERLEGGPLTRRWLDAACLAGRADPVALASAETAISTVGWYPCWLRFVLGLCRAESSPKSTQSALSLDALRILSVDMRPFHGPHRVVDLYEIHGEIRQTLARALQLLDDHVWLRGVEILRDVAFGTAVDLRGAMGGPLTFQILLDLIIDSATPANSAEATRIVEEVINHACNRRHYDDIARFRLTASRFALASGNRVRADAEWRTASEMLVAYGYRKDPTIYEIVDSLDDLIPADVSEVQGRLGYLQQLCERVIEHTDGKGTWHARRAWWRVLAAADPDALACLVAPAMLETCNEAHQTLDEARAALWRAQGNRADPLVAAALRLSIQSPLEAHDPTIVAQLCAQLSGASAAYARELLTHLLTLTDERPRTHHVSNDAELLSRDDEIVGRVDELAAAHDLPRVGPALLRRTEQRLPPAHERIERPVREQIERLVVEEMGHGARGLAETVRAWRLEARRSDADPARERFANAIGYRLLAAVEEGRARDAELALHALAADSFGAERRLAVLDDLASGLQMRGFTTLAVLASTLRWTSAHGGGGWLSFGSETELDSLGRAVAMDSDAALRVVGQEVQRVMLSDRSILAGITGSIILALARLKPFAAATQAAFACWDAAAEVIGRRLPRVSESDDPELPYERRTAVLGPGSGSPDEAFAIALVAGLAQPSHEQKRRTLVALRLVATARPDLMGLGLRGTIAGCSDSLTLCWLLTVLLGLPDAALHALVPPCTPALGSLCVAPELTIRSLARRLLGRVGVDVPNLRAGDVNLLLGARRGRDDGELEPRVVWLAGSRLEDAENLVPGIARAVDACAKRGLASDEHDARLRRQMSALARVGGVRIPEAVLDVHERVERCLQIVAGNARASFAASGKLLPEPVEFENELAKAILNDPRLALALEEQRRPRPTYALPLESDDPAWARRSRHRSHMLVARQLQPKDSPLETSGPYRGWRWLGWVERRDVSPSGIEEKLVASYRYCSIASQQGRRREVLWFGACDARIWLDPDSAEPGPLDGPNTQLASIDASRLARELKEGLGFACPVLTPLHGLVAALELSSHGPLVLRDALGPALVGITWRAAYEHSDYELSFPLLAGMRMLLRPDLFTRACEILDARPVWRECVWKDEPTPPSRARGRGA